MWEVALSFTGVFVGAFLAIVLENVRQRRVTRRWVFGHFAQLSDQIERGRPHIASSTRVWELARDAVDRWIEAESPDDVDESSWTAVGEHSSTDQLDLGHVLRAEALNVVPPVAARALAAAELANGVSRSHQSWVRHQFDLDVRDLWYDRTVPLDAAARRRLRAYRDALTTVIEVDRATADAVLELGRVVLGSIPVRSSRFR